MQVTVRKRAGYISLLARFPMKVEGVLECVTRVSISNECITMWLRSQNGWVTRDGWQVMSSIFGNVIKIPPPTSVNIECMPMCALSRWL